MLKTRSWCRIRLLNRATLVLLMHRATQLFQVLVALVQHILPDICEDDLADLMAQRDFRMRPDDLEDAVLTSAEVFQMAPDDVQASIATHQRSEDTRRVQRHYHTVSSKLERKKKRARRFRTALWRRV